MASSVSSSVIRQRAATSSARAAEVEPRVRDPGRSRPDAASCISSDPTSQDPLTETPPTCQLLTGPTPCGGTRVKIDTAPRPSCGSAHHQINATPPKRGNSALCVGVYWGWVMKLVFPSPQMWGRMATPLMHWAASARVAGRLGQNRLGAHPGTTPKSVSHAILGA